MAIIVIAIISNNPRRGYHNCPLSTVNCPLEQSDKHQFAGLLCAPDIVFKNIPEGDSLIVNSKYQFPSCCGLRGFRGGRELFCYGGVGILFRFFVEKAKLLLDISHKWWYLCFGKSLPNKCAVSHFNGSCINPVWADPQKTVGTNKLQGVYYHGFQN